MCNRRRSIVARDVQLCAHRADRGRVEGDADGHRGTGGDRERESRLIDELELAGVGAGERHPCDVQRSTARFRDHDLLRGTRGAALHVVEDQPRGASVIFDAALGRSSVMRCAPNSVT